MNHLPADEVREAVKRYILSELLPGESADELTTSTPLITSGVLDSITTLRLVTFLEEQFGIEFDAREIDPDQLDTIDQIVSLVLSKR